MHLIADRVRKKVDERGPIVFASLVELFFTGTIRTLNKICFTYQFSFAIGSRSEPSLLQGCSQEFSPCTTLRLAHNNDMPGQSPIYNEKDLSDIMLKSGIYTLGHHVRG